MASSLNKPGKIHTSTFDYKTTRERAKVVQLFPHQEIDTTAFRSSAVTFQYHHQIAFTTRLLRFHIRMKYSLLALFAPLFLIGLTTTAVVPDKFEVVDLSPRLTEAVKLFINSEINFNQSSSIYDINGTVDYTAVPSTDGNQHYIHFQSTTHARDNRTLELFQPQSVDCINDVNGPYYLDLNTSQWILQDANHRPNVFENYYQHGSLSAPQGIIQADVNFTSAVANISYSQEALPHLPQGHYYSIYFPSDKGHDPFVEYVDAISLVYKILQAQQLCNSKVKKN